MSNIVKINKKEFIQKFEPVSMVMEYRHIKNIDQAINEDANTVSVYVKELGYDTVSAVVELHLVALNQSINVNQLLSVYQIKEIAVELLATFYYISVVEIAYVFRKIKRGDYGKLYGALNMPDILGFFAQYIEERSQVFIAKSTKDIHNDHSLRSEDRKAWADHEKRIGKIDPDQ